MAEDEAGDEPADSCEGQDAAEDEGEIYQVVRGEWQGPYLEWEPYRPDKASWGASNEDASEVDGREKRSYLVLA